MPYEFATYEKRGRVAYVTLNRPEVMNALHAQANHELAGIWDDFAADDGVWVAILTGAGSRAFSAGNDLKATASGTGRLPEGVTPRRGGFGAARNVEIAPARGARADEHRVIAFVQHDRPAGFLGRFNQSLFVQGESRAGIDDFSANF